MVSNLAALVVAEQLLTPADLERIERERAASGHPLWSALLDAELITEDQLHDLLDATDAYPRIDDERLAEAQPAQRLLALLPAPRAQVAGVLPLELSPDGRQLVAVMVDPTDEQARAMLRAAAGVDAVRPLLAHPRALRAALQRLREETTQSPKVEVDPSLTGDLSAQPTQMLRAKQDDGDDHTPPLETTADEERAAEARLIRSLVEVIEGLGAVLEQRLGLRGRARTLARLSRQVARELGCLPSEIDQIGVVALLYGVDRALRAGGGRAHHGQGAEELLDSLGWAALGEGGIGHGLRALIAASSPFGRRGAGTPPLGARIVTAVADYLALYDELAAEGHAPDLGTVSQLLRAGSATAPVVDALLRALAAREPPRDKTPRAAVSHAAFTASAPSADDDQE